MNENNIPVVSGGLQEGAELYRRRGASDIDYDDTTPSQQAPAVKSMTAGADLYHQRHASAAE
ncbi:hypothetical protein ACM0AX_23460 [Mycobacteroides abscessus subsp. abscessus]|uniref:hypothetical protein n=1 Tax=Mycobacteroides abscessus TaxID=36809 RepID=UPI0039EF0D45